MSIQENRQAVVEDLQFIEDPLERMEYLVDRAKSHPVLSDDYRSDIFRIRGCQSKLWLVPEFSEGRCRFRVDSDSVLVKGIAALLAEMYSECTPEEIVELDPSFLEELGIREHLSHNRKNALSSVYKVVRG